MYISYTDKSYTEFYGCTGVPDIDVGEEISLNTYCFGLDDDGSEIRVQVLGVLSDLTVVRPNNLFRKRNRIKLSSLGRVTEDIKRQIGYLMSQRLMMLQKLHYKSVLGTI